MRPMPRVLRVVLAYCATLLVCAFGSLAFGFVTSGSSAWPGGATLFLVFWLYMVFGLLFTVVPFIIARATLAYFERRDVRAFVIAGGSVGAVTGIALWQAYGFTYVGESAWPRMMSWIIGNGLCGAIAGGVQWMVERKLGLGADWRISGTIETT
ncbi:hypothetical protein [Gymnodinialimonas hymeniacidonis]|uniref:hypothetical protein n=1 Tax=Gymnodinialimonas hymeniacidonis TaxID=3126508 RepID=UPI0034C6DC8B